MLEHCVETLQGTIPKPFESNPVLLNSCVFVLRKYWSYILYLIQLFQLLIITFKHVYDYFNKIDCD